MFGKNRSRVSINHRLEKNTRIEGTYKASGNVLIAGVVKGKLVLDADATLVLEKSADVTIDGTLEVGKLILLGGGISANQIKVRHLILKNGSVIVSNEAIQAESMEVEAGALLNARVSINKAVTTSSSPERTDSSSSASIARSRLLDQTKPAT